MRRATLGDLRSTVYAGQLCHVFMRPPRQSDLVQADAPPRPVIPVRHRPIHTEPANVRQVDLVLGLDIRVSRDEGSRVVVHAVHVPIGARLLTASQPPRGDRHILRRTEHIRGVSVLVDRLHTTPHLQDVLHRKIHHAHPVEYGPKRYFSGHVDGQSRYGSRASSGSMSTEYTRREAESARRFSSASSDGKNMLERWR